MAVGQVYAACYSLRLSRRTGARADMTHQFLNLATKVFDENQSNGLMICGINWGGADDSDYQWTRDVIGESFFSDVRFNDFPYRNRLLKWFELFGHPLAVTEDQAGPFERSVVQTNWMRNQSPNMHGKDLHAECVREWGNFEFHLERLMPKLLVFMSVQLLDVLNSRECLDGARRLFGPESRPEVQTRELKDGGKPHKRFRVGFQKFDRVQIVALPHPTGSKGLSDHYIGTFSDVIGPMLGRYKAERGFAP